MDSENNWNKITETELIEEAAEITGGNLKRKSLDEMLRLITVVQYIFDICVNELEERGEIFGPDGEIGIPYVCDYIVPTILNGRVRLTKVQ